MPSWKTKAALAGGGVAVTAAIAVLYVFDPASAGFYPPCAFRAITGFLCAGCGATRATHALLHGQLAEAFRLNAMFVVAVPFLLAGAAAEGRRMIHGGTPSVVTRPWIGWTIVAVLVGWGLLRNVVGV